jgi:hypothetical protein
MLSENEKSGGEYVLSQMENGKATNKLRIEEE